MRRRSATGDSMGRKVGCLLECMAPFITTDRKAGAASGTAANQGGLPGDFTFSASGRPGGEQGAQVDAALRAVLAPTAGAIGTEAQAFRAAQQAVAALGEAHGPVLSEMAASIGNCAQVSSKLIVTLRTALAAGSGFAFPGSAPSIPFLAASCFSPRSQICLIVIEACTFLLQGR